MFWMVKMSIVLEVLPVILSAANEYHYHLLDWRFTTVCMRLVSQLKVYIENSRRNTSMERLIIVRFHSFNQDFNIQPPPDDQIADEDG